MFFVLRNKKMNIEHNNSSLLTDDDDDEEEDENTNRRFQAPTPPTPQQEGGGGDDEEDVDEDELEEVKSSTKSEEETNTKKKGKTRLTWSAAEIQIIQPYASDKNLQIDMSDIFAKLPKRDFHGVEYHRTKSSVTSKIRKLRQQQQQSKTDTVPANQKVCDMTTTCNYRLIVKSHIYIEDLKRQELKELQTQERKYHSTIHSIRTQFAKLIQTHVAFMDEAKQKIEIEEAQFSLEEKKRKLDEQQQQKKTPPQQQQQQPNKKLKHTTAS